MSKKLVSTVSIIFGISLLTGCASIIEGTHQRIMLKTTPVAGARCLLKNDKGEWHVRKTPQKVNVHRSSSSIEIICSKKGYKTAKRVVNSKLDAAIAGNALLGGVVGAGIDAEDGAAYHYPAVISVPLKK